MEWMGVATSILAVSAALFMLCNLCVERVEPHQRRARREIRQAMIEFQAAAHGAIGAFEDAYEKLIEGYRRGEY